LLDPEHSRIDGYLTLFLYFSFFLLSKLLEFTTNGEKQDDCLDGLGDEVEELKGDSSSEQRLGPAMWG
jgi:hypothetical protein